MSQLAVSIHDQVSPALEKIIDAFGKGLDYVPNSSMDASVSASVPAIIFQKLNPIDLFGNAQFASDECGDTMWNEENLNPPSQH